MDGVEGSKAICLLATTSVDFDHPVRTKLAHLRHFARVAGRVRHAIGPAHDTVVRVMHMTADP